MDKSAKTKPQKELLKEVIADKVAQAKTILVNGLPIAPDITDCADAIDEANRINANNQAVIGTKISAIEAIVAAAGTAVTDSVLRLPDGTDTKGVDEYQLKDLLEAVMLGASRPLIHDIIKQLNDVINFKLNFQQRIDTNVELLRTMLAKTHSYGIALDDTIVALVIIHNVTCAQNETWGAEFRPVLLAPSEVLIQSRARRDVCRGHSQGARRCGWSPRHA